MRPSCLQIVVDSKMVLLLSGQSVPQTPLMQISTRPLFEALLFVSLISPSEQLFAIGAVCKETSAFRQFPKM